MRSAYLSTWNASGEQRHELLRQYWSADARYVDPLVEVVGRAALANTMDAANAGFPGLLFSPLGEVDGHHGRCRFRWGLGEVGGEPVVTGFDVVVLDDSGLIADVHGFLDDEADIDVATSGRGYAVGYLRDVRIGPEILTYMERIERTFASFGGRWLVHGSEPEVVEGHLPGAVVILEFPSVNAARSWYRSGSYQEIVDLRASRSHSTLALLSGVPSGYRAAHTIATLTASD
ncbi:MAG: DUF1330 domain-containing protein [Dermatophilaceae bacterium]